MLPGSTIRATLVMVMIGIGVIFYLRLGGGIGDEQPLRRAAEEADRVLSRPVQVRGGYATIGTFVLGLGAVSMFLLRLPWLRYADARHVVRHALRRELGAAGAADATAALTRAFEEAWRAAREAWEARDGDGLVRLFTPDAVNLSLLLADATTKAEPGPPLPKWQHIMLQVHIVDITNILDGSSIVDSELAGPSRVGSAVALIHGLALVEDDGGNRPVRFTHSLSLQLTVGQLHGSWQITGLGTAVVRHGKRWHVRWSSRTLM